MNQPNIQSPNTVIMVRPHHFQPNPQTAADNSFQQAKLTTDHQAISALAFAQVTEAAQRLRQRGICVHLFEDITTDTPDSVFPNNWFSTQSLPDRSTSLCLYPMYCDNRRAERRLDIINFIHQNYRVTHCFDYSNHEQQQLFLEGTGAMVLDHQARIAYAVRSQRMNERLLHQFCLDNQFRPLVFDAFDRQGHAIYHTNVMMSVGNEFVIIALDAVSNSQQRASISAAIAQAGKRLINITSEQMGQFAGNVLSLSGSQGDILVLSSSAEQALTQSQKTQLANSVTLVPMDVSALELAGGSIRCMLAGIHLPAKS